MAPSKLQRAIGAFKDQTSVGLAKVNGKSTSMSDLDVAIVKATRHEEYPAEEKYIREILSLTSYSRNFISACVTTLSRRLNKTKSWTVALKTLILIQRLLAEGDPAYEQEIFFATRRGTRLLNMSDFRDTSRSNSWDYSAFVRTYALYLDERLDYRMQGKNGKRNLYGYTDDDREETDPTSAVVVRSTPVNEMKIEQIFSRIQHLQQLLERFLACRPTGMARSNRVVIVGLYPIVKESFQIYFDIAEITAILIERFMELEMSDSIKVYDIFCRASKQVDELDSFYSWCKNTGIARTSEYPELEKITQKKLDLMDEFMRDKSALAQSKSTRSLEDKADVDSQEANDSTDGKEVEEDLNEIKALPPPESFTSEPLAQEGKEYEEPKQKEGNRQQEADLLNLADDAETAKGTQDDLALALFDGGLQSGDPSPAPTWEAFKDEGSNWETALVQSASSLPSQNPTLPGGLDMLLLNGMYQHGATTAAVAASTAYGASGSASSVAFGSAGRPAAPMLALPAPPTSNGSNPAGCTPVNADPFAASLSVAPPSYVQMNELERKQRLLVEEQMMWDQYARDGRQGHVGFSGPNHQNPYNNMGNYAPRY